MKGKRDVFMPIGEDPRIAVLQNAFQSGAGAPHSKTLREARGRHVSPPGFGVRQASAALAEWDHQGLLSR